MGVGYTVLASCPGTSFYLRFQACLTVYSHLASQVAFSQKSYKTSRTFVVNAANGIKSRIACYPTRFRYVNFYLQNL